MFGVLPEKRKVNYSQNNNFLFMRNSNHLFPKNDKTASGAKSVLITSPSPLHLRELATLATTFFNPTK